MGYQFESSAIDFAARLFTASFSEDQNVLVSPLSVSLALGMLLAGAEGKTKEELLYALAGELGADEFRDALTGYVKSLPSEKKARFHFANSIWVRKDFRVKRRFEKHTEKQFQAVIERVPFDEAAVRKINAWVKKETDSMIDSVIDSMTPEAMIYLINALTFEGEWEKVYEDTGRGEFTPLSGETKDVRAMYSTEHVYLAGEGATGFVKPYAGNQYSFVALLPDRAEDTAGFMKGLTAERFVKILAGRQIREVDTMLPKFSADYSAILNDTLKALGIETAFGSSADLSGLSNDRLSVGEVIHKTHIEVDELGTKAGAVTAIMAKAAGIPEPRPQVYLDRPFVYAIVDNQHLIPLFIGAVMDL